MKKIEKLGVHLAMLTRRKAAALAELDYVEAEIGKVRRELIETSPEALYKDTAELPQVGDERPTVTFEAVPQEIGFLPCPGWDQCGWVGQHTHYTDGTVR